MNLLFIETYIVRSDGTRAKILGEVEAGNGNIYLIDAVLHKQTNNLHGMGRSGSSAGIPSLIYQSKAWDFNMSNKLCANYLLVFLLYALLFTCF